LHVKALVIDIVNRIIKQTSVEHSNHMLFMSRISYIYTYSFTIQPTIYRDLAAGVGLAPLACCLEIFEA
jgi:hypothetical protein